MRWRIKEHIDAIKRNNHFRRIGCFLTSHFFMCLTHSHSLTHTLARPRLKEARKKKEKKFCCYSALLLGFWSSAAWLRTTHDFELWIMEYTDIYIYISLSETSHNMKSEWGERENGGELDRHSTTTPEWKWKEKRTSTYNNTEENPPRNGEEERNGE